MDESKFLTELRHSFNAVGNYFYKIPDTPFVAQGGGGFTASKPYDAISEVDGKLIVIEAKVQLDGNSWPFSKLRDSQKQGLGALESFGKNKAYIFVCMKLNRGDYRCMCFPFKKYGARGSIPNDWAFQIPRIGERYAIGIFLDWHRTNLL